jgi:hypothetical protein
MGQYHKIVNQTKRQYLEPFSMRASERFPAILASEDMTRSLSWLVCMSENPYWLQLKLSSDRASRLLGSWAGDTIEIVGDQNEEEFSHYVKDNFEDISYEIVALLFDIDEEYLEATVSDLVEWKVPSHLEHLGLIMLLKHPPKGLGDRLDTFYPGWRDEFDRHCRTQIYDPRNKFKRSE